MLRFNRRDNVRHLRNTAARFFDARDIRQIRYALKRRRIDIFSGTAGDIVHEDRNAYARNRFKVPEDTF